MDLNLLFVVLMFAVFIGILFSGYPIAFVLAGVGVIFGLGGEIINAFGGNVDADFSFLGFVTERIYSTMSNYQLVALPLFVFMGHVLDRSGVAANLLRALQLVLGRVPGGLALAVVVLGVVLAATTGIVGASVALLGVLALPVMLKEGYRTELAVGTVCASGCLGILIPPSIMLVLMGDQMGISVGDLFMGAVFPGLVLVGLYLAYIGFIALIYPSRAPALPRSVRDEMSGMVLAAIVVKALIPPLGLILAVLGSIFFGIASPTEAAGVGAMGAIILAAFNRELTLGNLRQAARSSAQTTSFIFAILLGATCFAVILRGVGGDEVITNLITGLPFGPNGVIAVILLLIFALGFILDWIEITLIVLPLVAPTLPALGVDPVWFAILVAVCLQTSFLTPPVGFALFYLKGVAPPEVTIGHLYRGIVPFVILQLIGLAIVGLFPGLATWLPKIAFG